MNKVLNSSAFSRPRNPSKSSPLGVPPVHWLERLGRVRNGKARAEVMTHKNPTGFPPLAGDGQANQEIPLAEHLRSAFLKTPIMLRPRAGMFLKRQTLDRKTTMYQQQRTFGIHKPTQATCFHRQCERSCHHATLPFASEPRS